MRQKINLDSLFSIHINDADINAFLNTHLSLR